MIIHNVAQGSVEWGQLRAGLPTASEFGRLVTSKFKARTGEMVETLLAAKLAEWWLGGPLLTVNTFDMDQGNLVENEARPWLSLTLERPVDVVGFITTDDGKVGCSPDGLIGDEEGVEIKSPQPTAHCKALISGEVPEEHLPQIHGGMFVTGFSSWKFLSYRRGFPKLVLTVSRDEEIQASIKSALEGFLIKLDAAKAHLINLNGGPPNRTRFTNHEPTPEFVSETPT